MLKFNFEIKVMITGLFLLAAACSPVLGSKEAVSERSEATAKPEATSIETTAVETTSSPTSAPSPTVENTKAPTATKFNIPWTVPEDILLGEEDPPRGAVFDFFTDFKLHSVPYAEILSGGPPPDGIPPVDQPDYNTIEEADAWIDPVEPVLVVKVGGEARAYPLQIMTWHEIVNDVVGGVPLAITFCPLCNTGIAFERDVLGTVLDFGTTGRLRFSNLIMYDRQTETWWQQATGEGIAGVLTGYQLTFYPVSMISWQQYKDSFPKGLVLSKNTGFRRSYGENPYPGYDDINQPPFLYVGEPTPDTLPATARVITLDLDSEAAAYPYTTLQDVHLVNDSVGGEPVVVFWEAGTASALDTAEISLGRDVGSAAVYSRLLEGEELVFRFEDGVFLDETGSVWNLSGQALSGPHIGKALQPLPGINHFWFSWAAFRPETRIYQP